MSEKITRHNELDVFKEAMKAAMELYELNKRFPPEERYSLTDQVRRSSRSVCANLAEAWRKRRYRAAFISKICDCEAEPAETQVWLEFASRCGYVQRDDAASLYQTYDRITRTLVGMRIHADKWTFPKPPN